MATSDQVKLIFDDWLQQLNDYKAAIDRDLQNIRVQKQEIQEIKQEIYNRIQEGYYLRDDACIVISAPQIIIGNVDKSGQLLPGASSVLIRSNGVDIQGVGNGGYIRNKATVIEQQALDTGPDGLEEVVHNGASVRTQARSIVLDSNRSEDVYTRDINASSNGVGITIHSDSKLVLDASVKRTEIDSEITTKVTDLDTRINELKGLMTAKLTELEQRIPDMKNELAQDKDLVSTDQVASTSIVALDTLQNRLSDSSRTFFEGIDQFMIYASQLAEKNRQKEALNKIKGETKSADAFKKEFTGAKININAEQIEMTNKDGDNTVRENDDTYLRMMSKNISIDAIKSDESNHKEGKIMLRGENISVQTNDKTNKDDNTWAMPATGKLEINSKEIHISSLDFEQPKAENGERQETALTAEGKIRIRTKKMLIDGTNTEKKVEGTIVLNGKKIGLVSSDAEGKELDSEGVIGIASKNIIIGKVDKLEAEKLETILKNEIRFKQGKDSTVRMVEDKLTMKIKEQVVVTTKDMEVDAKSKFKKDMISDTKLEGKQIKADKIEVSSNLKAPNLNA